MSESYYPRIEVASGFHLSRIVRGDKAAYLEHLSDPEIARNTLAIPFPYTEADADWWLDHCEAHRREPEMLFALRDASGYLVGAIGAVGELGLDARRAEVGYWLAAGLRGRGLMAAALRAYSTYAFERVGLHRLWAVPFSANAASQRALEKAGFQREGCLRQHYRKGDAYLDGFVYGLLRHERRGT